MSDLRWRDVVADVSNMVAVDLADGTIDRDDEDSWDEYAHEWADGSEWVIYYSNSRALFADGALDDFEDEARSLGEPESIDQWITAAACLAVWDLILATVREQVEGLSE